MTYQEFNQNICRNIQQELGSDATVTIQNIIKNNDTHLDGLTILSPQCNISPTIYLNYYFSQYERGKPLSSICEEILETYQKNKPKENIDITFFTNYDKVKSKIVFKLINFERNKELLSQVPHYRFLDLAIVFNCLLDSAASGNATILIQNHHLHFWNITKDDLYALSVQNTPVLLKYDLRNMTDVLKNILISEEVSSNDLGQDEIYPMYVLSNQHKINGSGCILYQNLLGSFSDRLNSDLYILPSSIHEVLIIPAYEKDSFEELTEMVREVNATQLSRDEILSDHVYYFSKETRQITM